MLYVCLWATVMTAVLKRATRNRALRRCAYEKTPKSARYFFNGKLGQYSGVFFPLAKRIDGRVWIFILSNAVLYIFV